MTALAVAGVIASGGLGEVGSAVITVLAVICTVTGAVFWLCVTVGALLLAVGRRHERGRPIVTPPDPYGDLLDVPDWLKESGGRG